MCFYVNEICERFCVAEEDIVCFKLVRPGYEPETVRSEYYEKDYIKGKLNKRVEIVPAHLGIIKCIYEGYHSYTNENVPTAMLFHGINKIVAKFIIPKGTKYFINPKYQEYVSENIIFVDITRTKPKINVLCC